MYCVPFNYDITLHEGGTYDKEFRWLVTALLTPVSVYGCTALLQVRRKTTDEDTILELEDVTDPWAADGESGIYILDDNATPELEGYWKLYIRDEDSLGLCDLHKDIGATYNMFLYNSSDEAILKQYGKFTIIAASARRVVP
jgi:hypothetical protein